jgi:hypothetical protein
MQNAAGGDVSAQSGGRDDSYEAIMSDLVSVIAHVQASMKRFESAIVRESLLGNQEVAADVVVLDDVTPRYVKASAALTACNADLRVALHDLMDASTPKHGTDRHPGRHRQPPRLAGA